MPVAFKRRNSLRIHLLAAVAVAALPAITAQAGVFSSSQVTSDAEASISSSEIYTHAIDFNGNTDPIINGMKLARSPASNINFNLSSPSNAGRDISATVSGNVEDMLDEFFHGPAAGDATLTLNGLTPGATYKTTFYGFGWDASPAARNVLFSAPDGGSNIINENQFGQNIGIKVEYQFTATSPSFVYTLTQQVGNTSWHHSGFTNEYISGPNPIQVVQTNNLDARVDSAATYTHAVDLAREEVGNANVNGVAFVAGNSGTGLPGGFGNNYTLAGPTNVFNNDGSNVGGGAGDVLDDFLHGIASGQATLTLDGLTPGQNYKLILLASAFGAPGGRYVTLAHDGGSSLVLDANAPGDNNGLAIEYTYTANAASQIFRIDPHGDGDTFHWYGFANSVVPEPAAAGTLLLAAGIAAMRRRRR